MLHINWDGVVGILCWSGEESDTSLSGSSMVIPASILFLSLLPPRLELTISSFSFLVD